MDLIDRQAAIDAMIEDKIQTKFYITPAAERDFEVFNDACDRHANLLKELPSAQPDVPGTNVGDMVSRQAVKDWLSKWEGYIDMDTIARMQCRVIDIRPHRKNDVDMFEIGKPYPLKGFEFKTWKDEYGNDWVEISKYQESWKGKQDG